MTFDSAKYFTLINEKYIKFGQALNEGFNVLNNTEPIPDVSERVAALHAMILNNEPFDKEFFTEEEYEQEKVISTEETKRLNDLMAGKLKAYSPTESDLSNLVITREELDGCFITEEDYLERLKESTYVKD
jgi:hypothetical protein